MGRSKRAAYSVDPAIIEENAKGNKERFIFANTLNDLLEMRGIDQEKMASDLGLSEGAIHNYRTGKTDPKLTALVKIANYLDVDCNYLMQGIESKHAEIAQLGLTNEVIAKLLWLSRDTWKTRINALNLLLSTREIVFILDCMNDVETACKNISTFALDFQKLVDNALDLDDQCEAFTIVEEMLGKAGELRRDLRYSVFELSESVKDSLKTMYGYNQKLREISLIEKKIFDDMHEGL